jgi:glycine hydroxymethyltransferase
VLAAELQRRGHRVCSGGTDNHLLLVDVRRTLGLPGKRAAVGLEEVGIVLNFNTIPNASDQQRPLAPDGIRLGTPSLTTRGMAEREMERVAEFIDRGLRLLKPGKLDKGDDPWVDPAGRDALTADVRAFASAFPSFRY